MRIRIPKEAVCGEVEIGSGEYWVALRHETKQVALVAGGRDLLIPATRRRNRSKTKTLSIQYFTGGGSTWSLVILDPKHGEWVSFISYNTGKKK